MRSTPSSSRPRRRRILGATFGVGAAFAFAACSDDDSDSPAPDNSQMIPNSTLPITPPGVTAGG